ncbi:hypothetical protein C5167_010693 [Papaver somniferum]|uniref:Uncharacterized protein n=1 Tax=Papaver somniferum TaxID=3469 RepID=A0A4Y7K3T4_PAPSO|nr:hypothetical protein C5167_010693 [Papaver somniferum]
MAAYNRDEYSTFILLDSPTLEVGISMCHVDHRKVVIFNFSVQPKLYVQECYSVLGPMAVRSLAMIDRDMDVRLVVFLKLNFICFCINQGQVAEEKQKQKKEAEVAGRESREA